MEILRGVWRLMEMSPFFALAVPVGFGLFLILSWDLLGVLRGRPSIFEPPAVTILKMHMQMLIAYAEQVKRKGEEKNP